MRNLRRTLIGIRTALLFPLLSGMLLSGMLLSGMLLSACASIDLPGEEESDAKIIRLRSDIAIAEQPLRIYEQRFSGGRDAVTLLKTNVLNRLLGAVASQRSDDLTIGFPPTRPLLSEQKSILGIRYTNVLDIDSGMVTLNLRRAELVSRRGNALRVFLVVEGSGSIAASGRYTGIPASAKPRIALSLQDTISLELKPEKNGLLMLIPRKREIMLHATFYVNLAGWEIPWKEDIPLQTESLLSAMELPSLISTSIKLPVPAREYSDRSYEFIDVPIQLTDPVLILEGERIRYAFDCEFK